jgi:cardiolipin hydrolase
MFFPNKDNELKLANLLSKAQKTLDICVFAFTNNVLREAILSVHNRNVRVRIIADDECSKFVGGEIYQLGAKGIQCTIDDN